MKFFSSSPPKPNEPKIKRRDPGDADSQEIFEVWGDVIDVSDHDQTTIDALSKQATAAMLAHLQRLLNDSVRMNSGMQIELCSDKQEQHYLRIEWNKIQGEIGARRFGACIDLFGILIIPKALTNFDPNPLVRLSRLSASQRRDVTLFQTVLKHVLDQTAEDLDEQRIS